MQDYLDFAKDLADKADKIMSDNFILGIDTEWKSDNTPLTVADTSINRLVIDEVKKRFPDHGVLGEEESFGLDRPIKWVVDPIDGTMPYSHGIPTSVFSLALVEDGQPIVAVVQDPFSNRKYYASKDHGSLMNDQVLKVNTQNELGPQTFIDISGHFKLNNYDSIKVLATLAEKNVRASKSFTSIYNSLPVATGQFAASIFFLEYPWDGAAISLIVSEAGGEVTDLSGNERRWDKNGNGCVISNGVIHQQLLDIVQNSLI